MVSNRLYCLCVSLMAHKLNFQGNMPKTDFLTFWLRQQSGVCEYRRLEVTRGSSVSYCSFQLLLCSSWLNGRREREGIILVAIGLKADIGHLLKV